MNDALSEACEQIEAARALCEVPEESSISVLQSPGISNPSPFSTPQERQPKPDQASTQLCFDQDSEKGTPKAGEQSNDLADRVSETRCKELEKELNQLKKFYEGVTKVNQELQLALTDLIAAKAETERKATEITNKHDEAKNEISELQLKFTDTQRINEKLKDEVQKTTNEKLKSDELVAELSVKHSEAIKEIEQLKSIDRQEQPTTVTINQGNERVAERLERELELSRTNMMKMRSFYDQEKNLNTNIQKSAKKVIQSKLQLENKVRILENELKSKNEEILELRTRLEAQPNYSQTGDNEPADLMKAEDENIENDDFNIIMETPRTDPKRNLEFKEFGEKQPPFQTPRLMYSSPIVTPRGPTGRINNPSPSELHASHLGHEKQYSESFGTPHSHAFKGQITRLHLDSKSGVINIDMSPPENPQASSLGTERLSPSTRLKHITESLATEMEKSVRLSSEISRKLS